MPSMSTIDIPARLRSQRQSGDRDGKARESRWDGHDRRRLAGGADGEGSWRRPSSVVDASAAVRQTVPDFQSSAIKRGAAGCRAQAMGRDNIPRAVTNRNNAKQTAPAIPALGELPARHGPGRIVRPLERPEFPLPGVAVFITRSHIEQRYGAYFIDPELTIRDWGVTYDELRAGVSSPGSVSLLGVGGQADCGDRGRGPARRRNPFEAPRSRFTDRR